jgi:hypothetical protein
MGRTTMLAALASHKTIEHKLNCFQITNKILRLNLHLQIVQIPISQSAPAR